MNASPSGPFPETLETAPISLRVPAGASHLELDIGVLNLKGARAFLARDDLFRLRKHLPANQLDALGCVDLVFDHLSGICVPIGHRERGRVAAPVRGLFEFPHVDGKSLAL